MTIQVGSGVLEHTANAQPMSNQTKGNNTMNTVKFTVAAKVLSTYTSSILEVDHGPTVMRCASSARNIHSDFAYGVLASAIAAETDNRKATMAEAWDSLLAHASEVNQGYLAGLVLTGSPAALRNAQPMDIAPISLPVGEARVYKAFHSLKELEVTLRAEPDLVDSLKRNGRTEHIKNELNEAWKEAPQYLRDTIIERAVSAKFAEADKTTRITHQGNSFRVKTYAWADMAALDNGGRAYRIRSGAERALQKALQLAHQYASSAEFWADVKPRQPNPEDMGEQTYAGEEHKPYESPICVYEVSGITHAEVYECKLHAIESVQADYEQAAQDAEELFDRLESLLTSVGDVIYGYHVHKENAKAKPVITPVHDKEQMLEVLDARAIERAMRAPAEALGVSARSENELRSAVLAQFTTEQQAELAALGGAI